MTEAPPSRRSVFGRGLVILLAWHVVLAGVPVLLLYLVFTRGDCIEVGCLLHAEPALALWIAVTFVGIPALVSLIVSVAIVAVLVLRSGYQAGMAAWVGASIGLVLACSVGLARYGFPS
jgi:hypothetical protein